MSAFELTSSNLVFPAIDGMRCKYSNYTEQKQGARFFCWFLIPYLRETKEKGVKSDTFCADDAVRAYVCVTFFRNALMCAICVVLSHMHVLELQASVFQNDASWIFRISGWTLRGHC